jgi:hypothetical protein
MRTKVVVAAALLSLLAACTNNTDAGRPASTAPSPTDAGPTRSSSPIAATCPIGDYRVSSITGKGTQVGGVPITVASVGALTLRITDAGTWQLSGDGTDLTLQAGGISVEATIDGVAEGSYVKAGEDYTFRQEKATGKVTLKRPVAGTSSIPMTDVGPALAPGGTAKLTCGAGTLTIASESVTLELEQVGGSTGASTPTSAGGTSAETGGSVIVDESARTRTIDCAGRDVAVNGSANTLTLTGSCGALSVNGSRNVVTVEKVAQISVNGSGNKITWGSGDPKVSNNGTGNTVGKGQ